MAAQFSVSAAKGQKRTVFANGMSQLNVVIVLKNTESKMGGGGSVEAADQAGNPLFGPALKPGEAIAFGVPSTVTEVCVFNLNDALWADVQILF
jgi:hypothetical protein